MPGSMQSLEITPFSGLQVCTTGSLQSSSFSTLHLKCLLEGAVALSLFQEQSHVSHLAWLVLVGGPADLHAACIIRSS